MSAIDEDSAPWETPHVEMPTETLVRDSKGGQLLWIDGVLLLPVGTRIELAQPRPADAVVTGVRLVAVTPGVAPSLVLDVLLEPAEDR